MPLRRARRAAALAILSAAAGCTSSGPTDGAAPPAPVAAQDAAAPDAAPGASVIGDRARRVAEQLRDTSGPQAFGIVQSLCDEVGSRFAGSPGDRAAVAWALRVMEAKGLARVRAEKVTVPRWERGEASARIVAPYPHDLAIAALGRSVGTPPGGLEGEVVEAASIEALEKLDRAAVEGKIVFVSQRTDRARDGSGYGRSSGVRYRVAPAAAKLGAIGAVIRSIGTDHDRLPHTGGMAYDASAPKIPVAALAIPDAELLHRLVTEGEQPVRLAMKLGCRALPDAESANVIGEVVGREAPDEIVLLGAHLDAWDLGVGAVDDGAGVAAVIDAARRILAQPERPRRTVRVVLFANEEAGLSGAKAYAAEHAKELDRHVVAIEADAGAGRVYEAAYLGADAGRPAFVEIASLLGPLGVAVSPEDAHGGADLSTLRPAGVPLLDLRQDMTFYFDVHHTANDTLDQVPPADLDQVAAAYAATAWALAEMPGDFGRIPEDKRKGR